MSNRIIHNQTGHSLMWMDANGIARPVAEEDLKALGYIGCDSLEAGEWVPVHIQMRDDAERRFLRHEVQKCWAALSSIAALSKEDEVRGHAWKALGE